MTDAVAGASGWAGAGLLGLVLWWLAFKHLPAKDDQLERLLGSKDAQIAKSYVDYREDVRRVLEHCHQETAELTEVTAQQFAAFKQSLTGLETAIRTLQLEMHKTEVATQQRHEESAS